MILLDTHVLVWLAVGDSRLGAETRATIDEASRASDAAVSFISFWEVAMLVAKGRLVLPMPPREWRRDLLSAGLSEAAIDGESAILAAQLRSFRGDSADRLIVATAIASGAPLVTADQQILTWEGDLRRRDARR